MVKVCKISTRPDSPRNTRNSRNRRSKIRMIFRVCRVFRGFQIANGKYGWKSPIRNLYSFILNNSAELRVIDGSLKHLWLFRYRLHVAKTIPVGRFSLILPRNALWIFRESILWHRLCERFGSLNLAETILPPKTDRVWFQAIWKTSWQSSFTNQEDKHENKGDNL